MSLHSNTIILILELLKIFISMETKGPPKQDTVNIILLQGW
jgi:hypothetical protein